MNRALSARVRALWSAGFEPCAHLEEEVAAREQLPAEPPRHGGPPASMHEHSCSTGRSAGAAHTRSDWPCANVRSAIVAARVGGLDARADRGAHAHAHKARRHEKATLHNGQKGAEQSAPSETRQTRRCVMQMPHGGDRQLDAHEKLCHVDVRGAMPLQKMHSQCMWKLHSMTSCTSSCDERVGTSATRSDLRKDGGAAQSSGSAAVARMADQADEKLLDTSCPMAFCEQGKK